jgi:hypothetical protein
MKMDLIHFLSTGIESKRKEFQERLTKKEKKVTYFLSQKN